MEIQDFVCIDYAHLRDQLEHPEGRHKTKRELWLVFATSVGTYKLFSADDEELRERLGQLEDALYEVFYSL